jgi:hypothetical protein
MSGLLSMNAMAACITRGTLWSLKDRRAAEQRDELAPSHSITLIGA